MIHKSPWEFNLKYVLGQNGIYQPETIILHRDDEYHQSNFDTLFSMQNKHFWYLGRHRFLLSFLDRYHSSNSNPWSGIDLGGGVGGWINHLSNHRSNSFKNLALGDSSMIALNMAGTLLPSNIKRYQIDLMNLGWSNQWDYAFLLDVIEHLPNDRRAIQQACLALKSGGYLFITAPALNCFWSYNDTLNNHLRRYCRQDFLDLARDTQLEFCDARYFMFILSPLYWLARFYSKPKNMTMAEKKELFEKTHRVPSFFINLILKTAFSLEAPLSRYARFPWGTSILGVFRKL
jgi:SAM-dependent methyltransferase